MSIVQISRIQHRRGRKGTTNIPQLASGELGWAIDTQELFIGNGAVSEGAPYVGNTKVLTEHDNILDLARQYQYKKNDPNIQTGLYVTQPVQRTIQDRLDDVVFVKSFGAVGNGEKDDYLDLQRAIDELFLNDATKTNISSRIVLELHAGIFNISQPLKIPANANIRGAGKDKTIIRQVGTTQDKFFSVFYTISNNSVPGEYVPRMIDASTEMSISSFTDSNQPSYLSITGLTFENTVAGYPVALIHATRNSKFDSVKFKGTWTSENELSPNEIGVNIIARSSLVTSKDNTFNNCDFVNVSYAIASTYDIDSNLFEGCLISNCGMGVLFGNEITGSAGQTVGPKNNKFISNKFIEVNQSGIKIVRGQRNLSDGNKFISVGNDGLSNSTAKYPVIDFAESTNVSINDLFDRSFDLSSNTVATPYVGEYAGKVIGDHKFNQETSVSQSSGVVLRLNAFANASYKVHYVYTSNVANVVRNGVLHVTVNNSGTSVLLTEEYDTVGTSANAEKLSLTASLYDRSVPSDGVKETIEIQYNNTTANDTSGKVRYWYEIIS